MGEGLPVVVFNARYDLTLLNAELVRFGEKPLDWGPVIDPMVLDRYLDTYRSGSRKLDAVCAHYNVRLEDHHDAGHDAIAVARLAWRMGHDIPELGEMPLDDLHALQIQEARRQASSFKSFLAVTYGVTDRRVAEGWPVETGPDDDTPLVEKRKPALPPGWNDGYYGGGYG